MLADKIRGDRTLRCKLMAIKALPCSGCADLSAALVNHRLTARMGRSGAQKNFRSSMCPPRETVAYSIARNNPPAT